MGCLENNLLQIFRQNGGNPSAEMLEGFKQELIIRLEAFLCLKTVPFNPVGFEEAALKVNGMISEMMHLALWLPHLVLQFSCLDSRFLGR